MTSFDGQIAVVTGGGSGIGRALVRQLVTVGCRVATCDLSRQGLDETKALCAAEAGADDANLVTFVADTTDEGQLARFADKVCETFQTDRIHLLFNNAGIGGGNSFVSGDRAKWEKTFSVCWEGVYLCTRVFMPLLLKAHAAHIVNTSSLNGFWAGLAPEIPNTAYSAAKYAVRGFSEALIADLRIHAPHVRVSVVMPGHIGTDIYVNSRRVLAGDQGMSRSAPSTQGRAAFVAAAPLTPAEAADEILRGVAAGDWRILVGADARCLDEMVRAAPTEAYEDHFFDEFVSRTGWWFDSQRPGRAV